MKKYMLISLAVTISCLSVFATTVDLSIHSKGWNEPSSNLKVVQLCNLTNNDLKEIEQGLHPQMAIEFPALTTLPISFNVKSDLVSLVENEEQLITIEINQTIYARYTEEGLMFSSNLTDWKPCLEFITGRIYVELGTQDGHPFIVIGSEINHRH